MSGFFMAAHESPRTTKLYDRTSDTLTLDEIERIVFCTTTVENSGETRLAIVDSYGSDPS